MYYTSPTFTEANDARPIYILSVLLMLTLLFDLALRHLQVPTHLFYFVSGFIGFVAFTLWANCLMGCIWHPIPKLQRADGDILLLRIHSPEQSSPPPSTMFQSLDDATEDGDSVNATQVELRDKIQWHKMFFTTACIAFNIIIIVKSAF